MLRVKKPIALKFDYNPTRSNAVVNLTREEVQYLLWSMGVDLSFSTKMSTQDLERRVWKAYDDAQRIFHSPSSFKLPLDPRQLLIWNHGSVETAVGKHINVDEIATHQLSGQLPRSKLEGSLNPFVWMRVALMQISENLDKGGEASHLCSFLTPETNDALLIAILGVYALSDIDPLFVVSYQWLQPPDFEGDIVFDGIFESGFNLKSSSTTFPNVIISTPELQKHLAYVLARNASFLDKDYIASRKEAGISCLVSFYPLSSASVGSLSVDTACAQCGETKSKKCAGCQSISYCSKECQKTHWKLHKPHCFSLDRGKWETIKLCILFPGMYSMKLNRRDTAQDYGSSTFISGNFPPNQHGNKPFIAKYQMGPFIMVYDRKKTFNLFCSPEEDPRGYTLLSSLIEKGPMGLKNYLWTRRVADDKIAVCTDILPKDEISW